MSGKLMKIELGLEVNQIITVSSIELFLQQQNSN